MSDKTPRFSPTRREAVITAAAAVALSGLVAREATAAPQALRLGRNQSFDLDWRFYRGAGEGWQAPDFNDSEWRALDLPHDWSIEDLPPGEGRLGAFDPKALGGPAIAFTLGGEGWYRKSFRFDGLPAGAQVQILFDGVYMQSDVWLNGHHLGQRVHGYTPFHYDLTPHLRAGDNVIAVRVRNIGKTSRWYSGSGIYRGVTLDVLAEPSHVARWGVAVSTREITDAAATLDIETQVAQPGAGLTIINRVRDAAGRVAAEVRVPADAALNQSLTLPGPKLWSPKTPALYTLETELRRGDQIVDTVSTPFGVRVISYDAQRGMLLNGEPTKLRGGCIHHDNGLLGAATYADADDRRVRLLKARGYNALRSSHYPASRVLRDACNRHGMMLIEEAFDMWAWPKNPQDYSVHFMDNYLADTSAMVLSARNDPSVIMWSIGNEVPHRSSPKGLEISWALANQVKRLDPTRPVTAGVNGFNGRPMIPDAATARPGFAGQPDESAVMFLDVVGYNYKLDRFAADHALYPTRVMYGSESFPRDVLAAWDFIDKTPYVIGDFIWAAMDYLGEAGMSGTVRNRSKLPGTVIAKWPWIIDDQGDLDIVGDQKPQSHARDVVWGLSTLEIAVQRPLPEGVYEHVGMWGWSDERQSWTWPGHEGQPMTLRVYTRADRVEIRVNGKAVASKTLSPGDKLPIELQAPYQPGSLEAVAYRDGREIGRRRFETAAAAAAVRLTAEGARGSARKGGLSYVWVDVVDRRGRTLPDAMQNVQLDVSGPATLIGFGSGNPKAVGSYQASEAQTFRGRALAILKSDGRAGAVRLRATSQGLRPAVATIRLS